MIFPLVAVILGSASAACPDLSKCYHGGMLQYPETNAAKFPRCWFREAAGHWGCYDPLNNSCSNINGRSMVDITACREPSSQEACSATVCFHGGQKVAPEYSRAKFPSCLWKEADGSWGCYNPLNNSCSNINGRNMFDIRSCPGQATRCPDLAKDGCQYNFNPASIRTRDQPQFWAFSNNVWGCSDDPNALAGRGQVINLMDPPAECRKNDESNYICE